MYITTLKNYSYKHIYLQLHQLTLHLVLCSTDKYIITIPKNYIPTNHYDNWPSTLYPKSVCTTYKLFVCFFCFLPTSTDVNWIIHKVPCITGSYNHLSEKWHDIFNIARLIPQTSQFTLHTPTLYCWKSAVANSAHTVRGSDNCSRRSQFHSPAHVLVSWTVLSTHQH